MTDDQRMARIRARQAEHNAAVESVTWFTSSQLAARWNIGQTTVLMIPRSALPYRTFGMGKRPRRRYSPDAVAAFEQSDARYSQVG
jgi:hypothetical protein